MIRIYTFTCPLGDCDPEQVCADLREQVGKLVKFQPHLVGFQVSADTKMVTFKLRMAHFRSVNLLTTAKRTALTLTHRVKLPKRQLKMLSWETEPSKQSLTLEQGRPERTKTTYQERVARPSPWSEASWWGDAVTSEPSSG